MTLPKEFEERMRGLLGDEYEAFSSSFDTPPVRGLRVNTLKMSVEAFLSVCDFPVSPIPFCPEGFYFECDGIGHHPLHHSGAVYVQEPAAMAVVECLEIKRGMRILDLCASPGGKTTQAASKLGCDGAIISNEIIPDRCKVLSQNAERLGIVPIVITNSDTASLCDAVGGFDVVIVDAPCSGEGMMRKNPKAVSEWSLENVKLCAARQREILDNAAGSVGAGGALIYSTCTFALEENEMQIDSFLSRHEDFYIVPVSEAVRQVTSDGVRFDGCRAENIELCRRFYPHISPGEGQFMAVLRRRDDAECSSSYAETASKDKKPRRGKGYDKGRTNGGASELETVRAFVSRVLATDIFSDGQLELQEKKDGFYIVPTLRLPERDVFMPGVKVGTVEKGRVIPHHRFFMAFGGLFKIKAELFAGDARVDSYLHGDVIPVDAPSGFAAVLYQGAPIGGGKISGGVLKNYYPKGLRE